MIPILLNKSKGLATLASDITGGIGEIADAYDGIAIEEANGKKEISFKLPIDSPRYSQVVVGSWIKTKVDEYHDPQIFEVYKITKPINGIVTVRAEHISYILSKATVMPFTATGSTMTCIKMIQNLEGTYPFAFETDIENGTSVFKLETPMSFRKAVGGFEGSILDVFGGELDWDNTKVKLLANRGRDRGVRVEYGKNLTNLTQEESIANVYDAVIGYATIDERVHVSDIQKITITDSPRTLNVDFSSNFDSQEELTDTEIKTRLNTFALNYAQNNDIGKPKVNIKVSFEPLSKFEEYQGVKVLEQTGLFDTVYVLFPKLGVEAKAKIIKTEYDFINEKMKSVELGDAKTNLMGLVDDQIESQLSEKINIDLSGVENAIGFLDKYVENLSQIISNSLGLFFTKVQLLGGGYQYYLHDKPLLANSMNQWTINQGGFALSTDGGQTWSAGIDAQGNAVLNSLSTITLKALEIYGSYIEGTELVFGDIDSNYIAVKVRKSSSTGESLGVALDGTGNIYIEPKGLFRISNENADGVSTNRFYMRYYKDTSLDLYKCAIDLNNYYYGSDVAATNIGMSSTEGKSSNVTIATYNPNNGNVMNAIALNYDVGGNGRAATGSIALINNNDNQSMVNRISMSRGNGISMVAALSSLNIDAAGNISVEANNSLNLVSKNYNVYIKGDAIYLTGSAVYFNGVRKW